MSFQAMTWAVEQELRTAEKMVLVMLANCCNHHTGRCDPSHKRLAKECGMSVSTLKRCIDGLEAAGLLRVENREQYGVNLPNQYHLLVGVGSERTHPPEDGPGVRSQSAGGRVTVNGGVGSEWPEGSVHSELQNRNLKQEVKPGNKPGNKPTREADKSASGDEGVSVPAVLSKSKQTKQNVTAELGELPTWIPVEAWSAFVEMRQAMGSRGKLTVNAARLIVRELDKLRAQGHEPGAVLEQSVMNNWKGVFGLKGQPAGGRQQQLEARNRTAIDDFVNGGGNGRG